MAEAVEKIGREDIEKKFIVQLKYGEKGYPSGKRATIVLSNVKIYYTKRSPTSIRDCKLTINAVYKNGGHKEHAEGYFLDDLNNEITTLLKNGKVNKIQANLVQNYSPCNNYRSLPGGGEAGCAVDIFEFKKKMEEKDIDFSLAIKFANFYLHDDESNREGLRKLSGDGVELKLLQGEDDWKKFLKDKTFVNLTEAEYTKLFERATSKERKEREKVDRDILYEITSESSEEDEEEEEEEEQQQQQQQDLVGQFRRLRLPRTEK